MRFPHVPLKPRPSPYNDLIIEATGAPLSAITAIQEIMRDEVFHSTLDWQTAEQFAEGAREAYAIYCSDMGYYVDEMARRHFSFHTNKTRDKITEAEQKLARAIASGKPERIVKCKEKLADLRQLEADLSKALEYQEFRVRRHLNRLEPGETAELQPA